MSITPSKYLIWHVIPIEFDRNGAWKVDSDYAVCRKCLTWVVISLAGLNRFVEKLFNDEIEMNIPLVPREESRIALFINNLLRFVQEPSN